MVIAPLDPDIARLLTLLPGTADSLVFVDQGLKNWEDCSTLREVVSGRFSSMIFDVLKLILENIT